MRFVPPILHRSAGENTYSFVAIKTLFKADSAFI